MPARLRVCLQEVGGWRVVCLVVCAAPFDTFGAAASSRMACVFVLGYVCEACMPCLSACVVVCGRTQVIRFWCWSLLRVC